MVRWSVHCIWRNWKKYNGQHLAHVRRKMYCHGCLPSLVEIAPAEGARIITSPPLRYMLAFCFASVSVEYGQYTRLSGTRSFHLRATQKLWLGWSHNGAVGVRPQFHVHGVDDRMGMGSFWWSGHQPFPG